MQPAAAYDKHWDEMTVLEVWLVEVTHAQSCVASFRQVAQESATTQLDVAVAEGEGVEVAVGHVPPWHTLTAERDRAV